MVACQLVCADSARFVSFADDCMTAENVCFADICLGVNVALGFAAQGNARKLELRAKSSCAAHSLALWKFRNFQDIARQCNRGQAYPGTLC